MTVYFDDNSYIQIQRQDGHHYVTINAIYAGRALDWQSEGRRFDPAYLHQMRQSLANTRFARLVQLD